MVSTTANRTAVALQLLGKFAAGVESTCEFADARDGAEHQDGNKSRPDRDVNIVVDTRLLFSRDTRQMRERSCAHSGRSSEVVVHNLRPLLKTVHREPWADPLSLHGLACLLLSGALVWALAEAFQRRRTLQGAHKAPSGLKSLCVGVSLDDCIPSKATPRRLTQSESISAFPAPAGGPLPTRDAAPPGAPRREHVTAKYCALQDVADLGGELTVRRSLWVTYIHIGPQSRCGRGALDDHVRPVDGSPILLLARVQGAQAT